MGRTDGLTDWRKNVAVHVNWRLHAYFGAAVQVSYPAAQEKEGEVSVPAHQPPGRSGREL